MNNRTELIEIEVDTDLLEQLIPIIAPLELTPERLIQLFFEWCVNPDTRADAIAWLLAHRD